MTDLVTVHMSCRIELEKNLSVTIDRISNPSDFVLQLP